MHGYQVRLRAAAAPRVPGKCKTLPPAALSSQLLRRAALVARRANIGEGGKPVIRPYTPVSHPDEKGHFDLVVKARPCTAPHNAAPLPRLPIFSPLRCRWAQAYPTGVMSKHFAQMKVGDTLECKGPIVKLEYKPNMKKSIGMVAGGTGITPMLQVIEEVLRNPADKTTLSLVFGNVTEADILLKSRIDALAAKHPQQFKARCGSYAREHARR